MFTDFNRNVGFHRDVFTKYTQKNRIELGFSPEKQGNHVMIGKRYRMNYERLLLEG